MATSFKPTSQYSSTPIVHKYITYLDIWTPKVLKPSINDPLVTLTSRYHQRPDLLSYDLYGTPRLWWVFVLRNMDLINDPIADFVSGLQIYTPTKASVEKFL